MKGRGVLSDAYVRCRVWLVGSEGRRLRGDGEDAILLVVVVAASVRRGLLLVVDDVARNQTSPAAFCLAFSPQAGSLIAGSGPRHQIRAWRDVIALIASNRGDEETGLQGIHDSEGVKGEGVAAITQWVLWEIRQSLGRPEGASTSLAHLQ